MVDFLDPRALPSAPIEAYNARIDATAGPISIGLLANGFPDSVSFLTEIEHALNRELPNAIEFHHYNKGDASIVAPDEMIERIAEACQAVVAAYGH